MNDKKWWEPVLTDEEWIAGIRTDYGTDAWMDDEALRQEYANGQKYQTLWDDISDAYDEYEPLADAYLAQKAKIEQLMYREKLDEDYKTMLAQALTRNKNNDAEINRLKRYIATLEAALGESALAKIEALSKGET